MKQITEAQLREVFEDPKLYHPNTMLRWPDTGDYRDNEIKAGWRHTLRVMKSLGLMADK